MQPSLFDPQPHRLIDDAEGGVRHLPGWVDDDQATRWFDELRELVPWQSQRRPMYDRVVDVPRLTAAYRLDDPTLPTSLAEAGRLAQATAGAPFNAVGLNLYRDGRDSVAPHHDKLPGLVAGYPIALVSLGATRSMTIRARQPPRRIWRIELAHGSLLLMSHQSQLHYEHGVPKTREHVGVRISLAFRVRPPTAKPAS